MRQRGSCIASDRILVDGVRVGYLYRERPDGTVDSGWRFFSGDESQGYVDDPSNFAIYDVNTVANYDPEVIPLLDAPIGAAYERDPEGVFVAIGCSPRSGCWLNHAYSKTAYIRCHYWWLVARMFERIDRPLGDALGLMVK